jgi:hypothetical protein
MAPQIDMPASIRCASFERKFGSLLEAVIFAVEECPQERRQALRLKTGSGDQFGWWHAATLYRTHVLNDPED